MSTIQDCSAEQLAKLFHHYREAMAHDDDTHGSKDASSWEHASQNERKLLVSAARLTLLELATTPVQSRPNRKYYANPGEADWGS